MRCYLNLNTVTLYAMWESTGGNVEPEECKALTQVGQTGTFRDPRDNNVYNIARLKDGKCWMTQNLRLVNKTISSDDSDMEEGSFTVPASERKFNSGDSPAAYFYNNNYGAYYNHYTATAGSSTSSLVTGNAKNSICPKGWHLPDNDFRALYWNYPDYTQMVATPFPAFVMASDIYGTNSVSTKGTHGFYWSSFKAGGSQAYSLFLYNPSTTSRRIEPETAEPSYFGMPIRCVAYTSSDGNTITFKTGNNIQAIVVTDTNAGESYKALPGEELQLKHLKNDTELAVSIIPATNNKLGSWTRDTNKGILRSSTLLTTTYTVKGNETLVANGVEGVYSYIQETSECAADGTNVTDKRDGKSYTIAKLADGKCWMTQNLRLGDTSPMILKSDTSDVTSDFELPASSQESFARASESSSLKAAYVDSAYGGYYNYYLSITNDDHNTNSICPKGWRPPTIQEYETMTEAYSSNAQTLMKTPVNFYLSGFIDMGSVLSYSDINGAPIEQGVKGEFLSSTFQSCSGSASFYLNSLVKISDNWRHSCGNGAGTPLRCIQRTQGENYQAAGDRYPTTSGFCEPCQSAAMAL